MSFEIAFAPIARRGRPFDEWLVAISASPPVAWAHVRTYGTPNSAKVRACQLARRLPHVRFQARGVDLYARARKQKAGAP